MSSFLCLPFVAYLACTKALQKLCVHKVVELRSMGGREERMEEVEEEELCGSAPQTRICTMVQTKYPSQNRESVRFYAPISDLFRGTTQGFRPRVVGLLRSAPQSRICATEPRQFSSEACRSVCFSTPIATLYRGANGTFEQRLSDSSILSPVRTLLARYKQHFPTGFLQLQGLGAHTRICTRLVQSCTSHTQAA